VTLIHTAKGGQPRCIWNIEKSCREIKTTQQQAVTSKSKTILQGVLGDNHTSNKSSINGITITQPWRHVDITN